MDSPPHPDKVCQLFAQRLTADMHQAYLYLR